MRLRTIVVGWGIWLVAALFYALDYFQHTSPSVLLTPIANSMGVGVGDIVGVMAIYFPVYALSQIPAGILLDKYGPRWCLSIACMVMSLGIIAFIIDSSLITMLIGRILIAIGSAFAFLGALKVASESLPKSVFPIAVGLTNTIGVLGGIFGQILLTALIHDMGWKGAMWLIGYIGIAFSFVIFILVRPKSYLKENKVTRSFHWRDLAAFKSINLWLIAIYAGIMVGTVVNAFSELYDVIFLQHVYHLDAYVAAGVSSMIFIGIAVGGPLHGVIARMLGSHKRWMVIANILTICIFALIVLTPHYISLTGLYLLYFFLGFFVSSMLLAFAVVDQIFPKNIHGTVLAAVNMTIGLSGALFQYLVDIASHWINGGDIKTIHNPNVFSLSFLVLLIPLIVSAILLWMVKINTASQKRAR